MGIFETNFLNLKKMKREKDGFTVLTALIAETIAVI